MSWSRKQIVSAAAQVRNTWGGLWPHIGPEIRTALVDAQAMSILLEQEGHSISIEAIEALHKALHVELSVGAFDIVSQGVAYELV